MVEERKVREGYKKTEIGLIPEDWEVKRLGDITEITMGQSPDSKNYNISNIGIPLIQGNADIKSRRTIIRQYTSQITKRAFINDIIMTVRAPVGYIGKSTIDCCIGRGVASIRYKNEFIYHYLIYVENNWGKFSKGTTFDSINSYELKELQLPIPKSESEQEAIANVLTDTDNLITSLEKLIDKKEKIKQGTMQELLTGKKRLDGFSGEWEVKELGEIAQIATGNTPPTNNPNNYGDKFMFVSPFDLGNSKYIYNTEKKLSEEGFELARKYPENSILVTCIGSTIGKIGIVTKESSSNQQINAIIPNDTFSSDYIYYYLSLIVYIIKGMASEQAVPIINKTTFESVEILFPPLPEQEAIAQILSDIDKEISLLEEKLDKYKTIKQGMMQELLTGRTRLI